MAVALFLWSGVTATAFAVATYLAADEMEIIVLEQNLSATATRIKQALLAGETPVYPNETWFRGGLESQLELPRAFRSLPAGSFNDIELDGVAFHVWIDEVPGDRLFLIYDLAVIEHYEHQLVMFLLTAVMLLSGLGLGLGMLGTSWVMRPVVDLSSRVSRIQAGTPRLDAPQQEDPDLAPMVHAINGLLERNHALVRREGQFTRIVSHELRNPLATLDAAIALLQTRAQPRDLQAPLGRAQRASSRLSDVVGALLQFSRGEAMASQDSGHCVAEQVLNQVLSGLSDDGLDVSAIRLAVDSDAVVPMQPALFAVLVSNLLLNALRHGVGEVVLRCDASAMDVSNAVGEGRGADSFAPDRLGIGIVELLCSQHQWAFAYDLCDGQFRASLRFSPQAGAAGP